MLNLPHANFFSLNKSKTLYCSKGLILFPIMNNKPVAVSYFSDKVGSSHLLQSVWNLFM